MQCDNNPNNYQPIIRVNSSRTLIRAAYKNFARGNGQGPEALVTEKLLSKQWTTILPAVLSIYVLLQALVGVNKSYSLVEVCDDNHRFPNWVQMINGFVVACFFISFCYIIIRIPKVFNSNTDQLGSLAANLTLRWRWGGLCRDGFG